MMLPGSGPPLDLNRLLEVLTRNDVDFVVVGGSAAGFLGASRLTEDADCVVRREPVSYTHLDVYKRQEFRRFTDATAEGLTN